MAPYEADAQLAFLAKESIVDLVITEDSDLLAFGCKRVPSPIGDLLTGDKPLTFLCPVGSVQA